MASQMIKLEMRSIDGWTPSSDGDLPHKGVSELLEDFCDGLRGMGATDDELLGLMAKGGDASLEDIAMIEASALARSGRLDGHDA